MKLFATISLQMYDKSASLVGATLLITGCCIGAGMIGLPVVSAAAGFIPSTVAMILCYFFATTTGLLLVEAVFWFDHKVHLISMAEFALGKAGKWIAWTFFLFLFYCLFVAYIDGGGRLFTDLLSSLLGSSLPREVGVFLCVFIVGAVVYVGTQAVSYVSRLFLLGLAISYGALVTLGVPHIEGKQLLFQNWKAAVATIPILFICFGYQNLVPTVVYYAKKDLRVIRLAVFIGVLIPFLIYSLWNVVILGMLPADGPKIQSDMVAGLLQKAAEAPSVIFFANVFSFFAILTPFMASAIAFVGFFRDGFKHLPKFQYDPIIYAFVLLPPTFFTLLYPHLFLSALGFAGGFVDAVLFGILPVLIVWVGRYGKKMDGPYRLTGGKPLLAAVFVFSAAVLCYRLSTMLY